MDENVSDSLHILPLHDMPLVTKALRSARLVKDTRLNGMLELFSEKGAGRGLLDPEKLGDFFDFSGDRASDHDIIRKLSALPSYDVYSLRLSLRDLGIDISSLNKLKLSDAKARELSSHMKEFTNPLVSFVFGDQGTEPASLAELLMQFANPDATAVRENLNRLALLLEVELIRIPKFLENYADVYMSLSFYRQCLEEIAPQMAVFMQALATIRLSSTFKNDRILIRDCKNVEEKLRWMYGDISGVLSEFRSRTEAMWENLTAQNYREMEMLVLQRQASIGATLCALTVKMGAWAHRFPPGANGQLADKAAFVIAEMKYGLINFGTPNAAPADESLLAYAPAGAWAESKPKPGQPTIASALTTM